MNKKLFFLSALTISALVWGLPTLVWATSPVNQLIAQKTPVWIGGGEMPEELLVQDYLDIQEKLGSKGPSTVMPQKSYSILATFEESKKKLAADKKITTSDIKSLALKNAVIKQNTINLSNGVTVTTDKAGVAVFTLPSGNYGISGFSIQGIDLNIPDTYSVDKAHTFIPVGVHAGTGRVNGYDSAGKMVSSQGLNGAQGKTARNTIQMGAFNPTNNGTYKFTINRAVDPQKIRLAVFDDKNNNAKFDLNEPILPWAGVPISLRALSK